MRNIIQNLEELFPILIDKIDNGVCLISADMRVIRLNTALEKKLASTGESVIGEHCYEVFRGQERTCPDCPVAKAFRTGGTATVLRETEEGRVLVEVYPLFDDDGQPLAAVTALRRESEAQTSRAELLMTVSLLQNIFDSTNDGILVIDTEGKTLYSNRQFGEMWRLPEHLLASSVYSQSRLAYVYGQLKDPEYFRTQAEALIHDKEKSDYTLLEFKDGRVFERKSVPYRVEGESVGRLWVFHDITERKRIQAELEAQRNELARISAVQGLGVLTGAIAHEINQPLAAIRSNAQAALRFLDREEPDLAEVREALQDIVADNQRADEVLRGIRRLLKGETAQERYDINEAIFDAVRLVRTTAYKLNVLLKIKLSPVPMFSRGDQSQFQQVVMNLLMNAFDELKSFNTLQEIVLHSFVNEAGWPSFTITDTGKGIDKEHLEKVFEPFVTTKPAGMGLGLAICRQLIESFGGTIRALHNPSGGAKFLITVPPALQQES